MPQSLSAVYIHLVFSTKHRYPFLHDPEVRNELHKYLGGISKNLDCPPITVAALPIMFICSHDLDELSHKRSG